MNTVINTVLLRYYDYHYQYHVIAQSKHALHQFSNFSFYPTPHRNLRRFAMDQVGTSDEDYNMMVGVFEYVVLGQCVHSCMVTRACGVRSVRSCMFC